METILSIEEFSDNEQDGYLIATTKQTIKLAIDNRQNCCENWGYFFSNDNLSEFIGATILNVTLTDDFLQTEDIPEGARCGMTMFITIDTNKGPLQFVAYNDHNGYYGHMATVTSTQLTADEYL